VFYSKNCFRGPDRIVNRYSPSEINAKIEYELDKRTASESLD
jgi:hypothetical protein